MDINELRKEIDSIDKEIVKLYEEMNDRGIIIDELIQ